MLTCMVLLQLHSPAVVQMSGAVPILEQVLDILDKYNKLAPGLHREDREDLSWPGVWSKFYVCHFVIKKKTIFHFCKYFHTLLFVSVASVVYFHIFYTFEIHKYVAVK